MKWIKGESKLFVPFQARKYSTNKDWRKTEPKSDAKNHLALSRAIQLLKDESKIPDNEQGKTENCYYIFSLPHCKCSKLLSIVWNVAFKPQELLQHNKMHFPASARQLRIMPCIKSLIDGLSIVSHMGGTAQQVVWALNHISQCGCVWRLTNLALYNFGNSEQNFPR